MDILRVKVNGEWTDIPAIIGPDGITFIPSVDSQGNLSWSNTGGQPNPPTVNIKGPQGQAGRDGATGQTGVAGTTFIPYVASNGDISWSNADGKPNPATVNIKGPAGANGQNGTNGMDGVSPTITVTDITGGHRVSVTDADGAHSFDVMDGEDYVLTQQDKADIAAMVDVPVQDVQVNGTSILSQGVANVPMADADTFGTVRINENNGIGISSSGNLQILQASASQIKSGTIQSRTITPAKQNESAFYGLAKAAGSDMASSSNPVGTYTDAAKVAIQKMFGVYREWELIADVTVSEDSVQVNVNIDMNGQPFELRKMYARVWFEPSTTGANDYVSASSLIINANDASGFANLPTKRYMANGAKTYIEYIGELIADVHIGTGKASSNENSTGSIEQISGSKAASVKAITGLRLSRYSQTSSLIPKDTTIKIYGIRI